MRKHRGFFVISFKNADFVDISLILCYNFNEVKVMDELTSLIKSEIKRQYKSVRQFSAAIDVPQSTIISAMKKGVGGTAFDTVLKMCKALHIKLSVNTGTSLDKEKNDLVEAFSELDEKGKYAVKALCGVELMRCRNIPILSISAASDKRQSNNSNELQTK